MATHPILPCCRRTVLKNQETLVVETSSGQRITLQNTSPSVVIEDANGNQVRLESGGITLMASAKITIAASLLEISAGELIVNAGMSRFSGVVQADTVIANSVIQP